MENQQHKIALENNSKILRQSFQHRPGIFEIVKQAISSMIASSLKLFADETLPLSVNHKISSSAQLPIPSLILKKRLSFQQFSEKEIQAEVNMQKVGARVSDQYLGQNQMQPIAKNQHQNSFDDNSFDSLFSSGRKKVKRDLNQSTVDQQPVFDLSKQSKQAQQSFEKIQFLSFLRAQQIQVKERQRLASMSQQAKMQQKLVAYHLYQQREAQGLISFTESKLSKSLKGLQNARQTRMGKRPQRKKIVLENDPPQLYEFSKVLESLEQEKVRREALRRQTRLRQQILNREQQQNLQIQRQERQKQEKQQLEEQERLEQEELRKIELQRQQPQLILVRNREEEQSQNKEVASVVLNDELQSDNLASRRFNQPQSISSNMPASELHQDKVGRKVQQNNSKQSAFNLSEKQPSNGSQAASFNNNPFLAASPAKKFGLNDMIKNNSGNESRPFFQTTPPQKNVANIFNNGSQVQNLFVKNQSAQNQLWFHSSNQSPIKQIISPPVANPPMNFTSVNSARSQPGFMGNVSYTPNNQVNTFPINNQINSAFPAQNQINNSTFALNNQAGNFFSGGNQFNNSFLQNNQTSMMLSQPMQAGSMFDSSTVMNAFGPPSNNYPNTSTNPFIAPSPSEQPQVSLFGGIQPTSSSRQTCGQSSRNNRKKQTIRIT